MIKEHSATFFFQPNSFYSFSMVPEFYPYSFLALSLEAPHMTMTRVNCSWVSRYQPSNRIDTLTHANVSDRTLSNTHTKLTKLTYLSLLLSLYNFVNIRNFYQLDMRGKPTSVLDISPCPSPWCLCTMYFH